MASAFLPTKKIFGIRPILTLPTGSVSGFTKGVLVGTGAGLLGGMAFFGTKQMLEQQQKQLATTGGYVIYAYPESQVSVTEPTTGSITQEAQQKAEQKQEPNYLQLLFLGLLGLGAMYILKR